MQLTPAMIAALKKTTTQHRWFIWFSAKNREDGQIEESGLWSGEGPITVTVNGQSRTYSGAGGLIGIQGLTSAAGTNIQSQTISLTALDSNVFTLLRVYEPKNAKADIAMGLFNPETETLIGIVPVFDGFVDTMNINSSETDASVSVSLVSSLRNASRPLYAKQSHEAQLQRDPTDMGREYSSISGQTKIWWGIKTGPYHFAR